MGNEDSIPHSLPHSVRTVLTLFLASMAAFKIPTQDTIYILQYMHHALHKLRNNPVL
jgi:hypothetical protein